MELIQQFDLLASSLGGVAKLRELILSLAVRGKLVPQDPADEPASVLLQKIRAEKDRLIKEGKIKRDKATNGSVEGKDVPCTLPEGWEWASFATLGWFGGGKTPSTSRSDYWDGNILWVTPKDMKSLIVADTQDKVTKLAQEDGLFLFEPNSVLVVVRSGILRRTVPVAINSTPCTVNQDLKVLSLAMPSMAPYVQLMIRGFEGFILQNLTKVGTTVESIRFDDFEKQPFPLPPLPEQSRIVAKVDELMALCDRLEAEQGQAARVQGHWVEAALAQLADSADADEFARHWQHLAQHFDTLFTTPDSITQLEATLLQLAVRGKLVPQDPNDEPASTLLQKIRTEKDRLLAEGKIKKDKSLPPISDEEKPFALPEGWEWVKLGFVTNVLSGNAFDSEDFSTESGIKAIKITNAGVSEFIETNDFLPTAFAEKFANFMVKAGDLILALTRPYISSGLKISRCPASYDGALLNQRVAAIRCEISANSDFVFLFMRSKYVLGIYQQRFGNSGLQPNLKVKDVTELLLPLPSVAEQSRIVAKVEALFALTANLKAQLAKAQHTQALLADVLLETST